MAACRAMVAAWLVAWGAIAAANGTGDATDRSGASSRSAAATGITASTDRGAAASGGADRGAPATGSVGTTGSAAASEGTTTSAGATARTGSPVAGAGEGKKLFAEGTTPSCSTCHALRDAGATGNIGPNLDELRPDASRVAQAVKNGFENMPAFGNVLSDAQIQAVSRYVEQAAGRK